MESGNSSLQRSPTVEMVLEDMRERLILNQFEEGVPLAENTLAGKYGVSRGTVRVALQTLEKEGLLLVLDNGRKAPLQVSEKFVRDLYSVRGMIEREAVLCCLARPSIDGQILTKAFSDFYKLYTYEGDELYRQRSIINADFHRAVVTTAGKRPLLQCWNTIDPLVRCITKLNCFTLRENEDNGELVESHRLLMDAIFKKQPDAACLLQRHIETAKEDTMQGLLKIK